MHWVCWSNNFQKILERVDRQAYQGLYLSEKTGVEGSTKKTLFGEARFE